MIEYNIIKNKSVIHSDYLNEEMFNLLDKTFIIPQSYEYNVFEVTSEYIARPDLIADKAYGDVQFASIICKLNGISNPFELNEGMLLILPSLDDIMNFCIVPSSEELESSNSNKPISKSKNEKRKANQSVIGDSRFNIDSSTGIIIY